MPTDRRLLVNLLLSQGNASQSADPEVRLTRARMHLTLALISVERNFGWWQVAVAAIRLAWWAGRYAERRWG